MELKCIENYSYLSNDIGDASNQSDEENIISNEKNDIIDDGKDNGLFMWAFKCSKIYSNNSATRVY